VVQLLLVHYSQHLLNDVANDFCDGVAQHIALVVVELHEAAKVVMEHLGFGLA